MRSGGGVTVVFAAAWDGLGVLLAVSIARQFVRASAVLMRKHADVSNSGVIVRRGVTVVRGVVVVTVGVRDSVGDLDGDGDFDGPGWDCVTVRDGRGVLVTAGRDVDVGLNSPQSLRHAVSPTAHSHGYGLPVANCRNSPVRSRSNLAIIKNVVAAKIMSRTSGRIWINPAVAPLVFRVRYL